jgi:hypothetical protein
MYSVPLEAIPNQTISFNADGAYWQVHLYQSIDHVCADIDINGVNVISGVRCFGGYGLMPYAYMYEPNYGNFVFDTDADWTNFGSSCNLYYLENAEYAAFQEAMNSGVAPPLTVT